MAVRIRMKRIGGTNDSCFRVVVMDQRSQRDGRAIEEIGFHNPNSKIERLDMERFDYWMSNGASPSDTVKELVYRIKNNVVLSEIVRKPALSKKAQAKLDAENKAKAEAEAQAKAAAEAPAAEAAPAQA